MEQEDTRMTEREKLLNLIIAAKRHDPETGSFTEWLTDYLLANGVTIQKWIPVTERLPQEFVSVLVCIPSENPLPTVKEAYLANGAWATKMAIFFMEEVTYWMPLPEPPKEEA